MVMKHALSKDILREIRKTMGRFLSIFAIVAIGVGFFAGVKAAAPVMKHSSDQYYDQYNLMDIRVVSTMGITEDDLTEIKGIAGVDQVYPGYTMDVLMKRQDSSDVVLKALSLPDLEAYESNAVNKPYIVEGRYPANSGECLIETGKIHDLGLSVGDKIVLETGTDEDIADHLKVKEYTIVGLAESPRYVSYQKGETTSIGNGSVDNFILIPEGDFKQEIYSEVLLTVKDAKALDTYSSAYEDKVEPVVQALEKLGETQSEARFLEIKQSAQAQLDAVTSQLPPDVDPPAEMQAQIDEQQKKIDELTAPEWYVLDRDSLYGYVDYKQSSEKMGSIASVFPYFFFLVAALVSLTTMTRMVDEHRQTIGTLKALGYSKASIAMKYIIYAVIASITGSIFGLAIGMTLFPIVIFNAWNTMYTVPEALLVFDIKLALGGTLASVLITSAAAVLACYKDLMETPSMLMRPKAPKQGKQIGLERIRFLWKRLSFTQKVTARNLFRYKKRFYMTIIGISGCTALLLTGFGIKDSMGVVVDRQFGEIVNYEMSVAYESNLSHEQKNELIAKLEQHDHIGEVMQVEQLNSTLKNADGDDKTATLIIPEDVEQFKSYLTLRSPGNQKELQLSDDGAIITEQLADDLGLGTGDVIQIEQNKQAPREVPIIGVTENYLGHYVYMSPAGYQQIFGEDAVSNSIYAQLIDNTKEVEDQLAMELMQEPGLASIHFNSTIMDTFNRSFMSIDYIIILIIASAGALAFVVLYNLTNVNVSERIREIATIKVLGFYDKEVSSYVYRENVILTIIGSFVGLVLGIFLHRFIMDTLALEGVMPGENIYWLSYVYSVGITMLFAIFVNTVMNKKLRNIPMIESLKSVE